MPSFNDGMEGPSIDDNIKDLTIVNFVDGGMEGPFIDDNIDFARVYTTCILALCNDGDHDDHWWCYCVNCQSRELFILDALGHKRRSRNAIDKAMEQLQLLRQQIVCE
ncbi:hypothetical protein LR48_Vigan03g138500 [Vigna angularis]|uniref:Ubiquitin-like protease family profile domain-containing protein n=1 Tax=Phaseolus angularis TaxID=3914 RepID=A0A0L9U5A1_PHAAN|nr:hypothetical protein LR48_Vigan03g138500 [Vigna angularis]